MFFTERPRTLLVGAHFNAECVFPVFWPELRRATQPTIFNFTPSIGAGKRGAKRVGADNVLAARTFPVWCTGVAVAVAKLFAPAFVEVAPGKQLQARVALQVTGGVGYGSCVTRLLGFVRGLKHIPDAMLHVQLHDGERQCAKVFCVRGRMVNANDISRFGGENRRPRTSSGGANIIHNVRRRDVVDGAE